MKKDKKTVDEKIKKTNIIKDFKEIAHDIFLGSFCGLGKYRKKQV